MSGVSFSSSASQRVRGESVMSLAEFVGLSACGAVGYGGSAMDKIVGGMFSDKVLAAYHAYLRKFEAVSPVGSQVSVSSGKSSLARSKALRALKSWRTPSVATISPGFCYLRAVKREFQPVVRDSLGPNPTMSSLLKQPAECYTSLGDLRLSSVGPSAAHLSDDGESAFGEVLADLASRVQLTAAPGSLWHSLCGKDLVKSHRFCLDTTVGGKGPPARGAGSGHGATFVGTARAIGVGTSPVHLPATSGVVSYGDDCVAVAVVAAESEVSLSAAAE